MSIKRVGMLVVGVFMLGVFTGCSTAVQLSNKEEVSIVRASCTKGGGAYAMVAGESVVGQITTVAGNEDELSKYAVTIIDGECSITKRED